MKIYTWITAASLLALPLAAAEENPAAAPAPAAAATESDNAELESRLAELKQKSESGDTAATQPVYTRYAIEGLTEQARTWAARYEQQLGQQPCSVPVMDQYVLAEFIASGSFERHLNRARRKQKGKDL